ncbi:hypothetical protein O6H91_08G107400 [Diphasiastrum complanatum]|uniref:Uncharacterized protein n=1 Tax=Diphasiastrum complanatum TaxID=34168 RepID=A0ACC2D0U2_DIPCM|nr:hypothetical protein O6H91_08G107400 [Diphasiastrum complanatum]
MRPYCGSCSRPTSVCLCSVLPSQPFHTLFTAAVILQHPHEVRHPLATVPILAKSMQNCEVIVGRRFKPGASAHLDSLARSFVSVAADNPTHHEEIGVKGRNQHALLLFPGSEAVDLERWLTHHGYDKLKQACECAESVSRLQAGRCASTQSGALCPQITLLLVDGTWQHAKEMVKASLPFLKSFVVQVCLPFDLNSEGFGMGDSSLTLRKEPFQGYLSTMEAAARALGVLEPHGREIEGLLLSILQKMVSLQAAHFTPLRRHPGRAA